MYVVSRYEAGRKSHMHTTLMRIESVDLPLVCLTRFNLSDQNGYNPNTSTVVMSADDCDLAEVTDTFANSVLQAFGLHVEVDFKFSKDDFKFSKEKFFKFYLDSLVYYESIPYKSNLWCRLAKSI